MKLAEILTDITSQITTNGAMAITGSVLASVLTDMANNLVPVYSDYGQFVNGTMPVFGLPLVGYTKTLSDGTIMQGGALNPFGDFWINQLAWSDPNSGASASVGVYNGQSGITYGNTYNGDNISMSINGASANFWLSNYTVKTFKVNNDFDVFLYIDNTGSGCFGSNSGASLSVDNLYASVNIPHNGAHEVVVDGIERLHVSRFDVDIISDYINLYLNDTPDGEFRVYNPISAADMRFGAAFGDFYIKDSGGNYGFQLNANAGVIIGTDNPFRTIGFFGAVGNVRGVINPYPGTYEAADTYTTNERDMLNNLNASFRSLVTILESYNLFTD